MKKIILFTLLALSIVACDKNNEKMESMQTKNVQMENMNNTKENISEEFEILSYVDENKEISVTLNSNDFFETAVLTYKLRDGDKHIVNMEREVSASGMIMNSTEDSENSVEYLSKGEQATFIIDGVKYETKLVK